MLRDKNNEVTFIDFTWLDCIFSFYQYQAVKILKFGTFLLTIWGIMCTRITLSQQKLNSIQYYGAKQKSQQYVINAVNCCTCLCSLLVVNCIWLLSWSVLHYSQNPSTMIAVVTARVLPLYHGNFALNLHQFVPVLLPIT